MKRALFISAVIVLSAPVFFGCSSTNSTSSTQTSGSTTPVAPARTPEKDLAIIESGGQPTPETERVFTLLLDETEPKCTEGRRGVADLTVKAVEVAKSKGAKTNHVDMLTGASKILAEYDRPQECLGIFTALVVSITN